MESQRERKRERERERGVNRRELLPSLFLSFLCVYSRLRNVSLHPTEPSEISLVLPLSRSLPLSPLACL